MSGVKRRCEDPRCASPKGKVWHCADCDTALCDLCWPMQLPHKPGKVGRDGMSHEKADYEVVQIYESILHPPKEVHRLQQMHNDDSATLWFGQC